MKVYLIRHTAVDVPAGICYGQTDVPLRSTFEEEAKIVSEKLKGIQPDAAFSSPLSRCTQLADYCGFSNVILDNRLKELNFGDWEGAAWNKVDMSVWKTDWINPPALNGESFVQMYNRVAAFFDELKRSDFDTVFIFAHGGVVSCARVYFGQADINGAFKMKTEYGSVNIFDLPFLETDVDPTHTQGSP